METRDVNKVVKNSADKFPGSCCLTLRVVEKQDVVENFLLILCYDGADKR